MAFEGSSGRVVGQSSSPGTAFDKLVQAFVAVQDAESHGVSHGDIIQLAIELNTAFGYYQNSTRLSGENNSTGATTYATLTINLSSDVSSKARILENNAQNQLLLSQALAYATALVIAVISAILTVEFHRIRAFLHRRRIFRSQLGRV